MLRLSSVVETAPGDWQVRLELEAVGEDSVTALDAGDIGGNWLPTPFGLMHGEPAARRAADLAQANEAAQRLRDELASER